MTHHAEDRIAEQSETGHPSAPMRLGFWSPVYGNWIVSRQPDTHDPSFAYTRKLTLLAEDIGFATVLLAEHTFNPFGPGYDQQENWSTTAALASITQHIELMPAVRPAFKHPVIVAKMASSIDHFVMSLCHPCQSTSPTPPSAWAASRHRLSS